MDSVTDDRALVCRVSPFGNLRIDAYVPLPEAYRSLSRPSSAPDAKAFPLCSFSLNLASMQAPYRALRCISFSSRIFIRSDGDEGSRACRDIGSLNYAGSFQDHSSTKLLPIFEFHFASLVCRKSFRSRSSSLLPCFSFPLFSFQGAERRYTRVYPLN